MFNMASILTGAISYKRPKSRSPVITSAFFFSCPVIPASCSKILFVLRSPHRTKSLFVPADEAVAAAVDPPVVVPLAPANATCDNNAQNAVVPAPHPVAQVVIVFSSPCIRRFPSCVLGIDGLLAWFSLLCY